VRLASERIRRLEIGRIRDWRIRDLEIEIRRLGDDVSRLVIEKICQPREF